MTNPSKSTSPPAALGSRRRSVALALAVVLIIAGLVWVGVNVYSYAAPQPLWTREDLPPIPAGNGWSVVTADEIELEIPPQLGELSELGGREGLDAERFWQELELEAETLRRFMLTYRAQEALDRFELARRSAAFVEDCAPADPCRLLAWRDVHRVAVLRSIELALADQPAAACTLLGELIEMDLAHLQSTHSQLGVMVASRNLLHAASWAEMLARRLDPSERSTERGAALAELADAVRRADVRDFDVRLAVIGEYLFVAEMLDTMADPGREAQRPRWLFNRSLTLRSANEQFERRYASALAGDTLAALGGGERSPRERFGWWLSNPGGKLVLEMLLTKPEGLADSIDETLAEIQQTRSRVLTRLAELDHAG
jgi:hypothetical protein